MEGIIHRKQTAAESLDDVRAKDFSSPKRTKLGFGVRPIKRKWAMEDANYLLHPMDGVSKKAAKETLDLVGGGSWLESMSVCSTKVTCRHPRVPLTPNTEYGVNRAVE